MFLFRAFLFCLFFFIAFLFFLFFRPGLMCMNSSSRSTVVYFVVWERWLFPVSCFLCKSPPGRVYLNPLLCRDRLIGEQATMTINFVGPTLFFFFSFRFLFFFALHDTQPRKDPEVLRVLRMLPANRPGETTDPSNTSPEQKTRAMIRCVSLPVAIGLGIHTCIDNGGQRHRCHPWSEKENKNESTKARHWRHPVESIPHVNW